MIQLIVIDKYQLYFKKLLKQMTSMAFCKLFCSIHTGRMKYLCMCFIISLQGVTIAADTLYMNKNWLLRSGDQVVLREVGVPGYVPLALVKAGLLPALFSPEFEPAALASVSQVWSYVTNFEIDSSIAIGNLSSLICNGLDTYTDVFINDQKIASSSNMFIPLHIEVSGVIRAGSKIK